MRRSMKRVNVKKENKPFKTLAIATITGLSIIGVGQAQATTLDDIDLSQKPINTPTLDYLHNNDVKITDENGTEVAIPQSSYTMTEVKANEDGSKPTGDNIITQYSYDKTTGSLSPLYYEINHQTQFGNPDGDTTLTFGRVEYQQNGYTNYKWELNPENPTRTITYKYNQGDAIDGSITNDSTSANIARDFVNTNSGDPLILNNENATINNITGNFIANGLSSSSYRLINNKGHIDNIKGTFAINKTYNAVINNNENATINKIEGLFVNNEVATHSDSVSTINNAGIIKSILADFIQDSNTSDSYGSFIVNLNTGKIENIIGDFIVQNKELRGIKNYGKINNIKANFIGNTQIYNNGTIDKIEGTFSNDKVVPSNKTSDFNDNQEAGIINATSYTTNSTLIKLILADFIANQGGGISNIYGGITDIIGSFIGNSISITTPCYHNQTVHGGAIYNADTYSSEVSYIGNISGTFLNNYVSIKDNGDKIGIGALGGAIYNGGRIDSITNSHFQNNYAEAEKGDAFGGAIYNTKTRHYHGKDGVSGIGKIQNTSFIGNYAKSQSGKAQGGAIWSNRDLNIVADNGESLFSGNYVQNGDKKDQQAIFVTNLTTTEYGYYNSEEPYRRYSQKVPIKTAVTLNSINNGKIIFNDKITGETTKTPINKYYNRWDSSAGKYILQG